MSSSDSGLPFDDDEAEAQEVGGNVVTNDPDAPGLARGVMEMLIGYVQRTAEIKDELASRGADALVTELASIHDKVKEIMVDGGPSVAFDETSGWEAVLSKPRQLTVWDHKKAKKVMTPRQQRRYFVESLDMTAVYEGLENGDLSMTVFTENGVVTKGPPGSRALTIRERKKGKK